MTEKNNLDGWKLVPIEPTKEMWAAVNKLDDQMAAGSYDGKGCSIEQAWNCMLAAAPSASAQQAEPVAKDIPRFDLDMDGSMDAFPDGRWVRYEDYCKTLAPATSASHPEPIYQFQKADGSLD